MIRLTCAVLLAVLALQCAPALAGTTVRIAVTSGGHGTTSLNPLDRSVKALEARFGPSNVTIRDRVPLTELGHMLERGEVDYFISTSGVSRRNLSEGSRDLLTITDSRFPDPNKSYGSLFFTRRDSGIKRLKDMRGRTLVANHPNGPYSYLVGMGEIERAGYDATAFFKSQRFLMQSAEDVVQAVLDGRADVGVVASCILEDFFPADSEARRKLEPVALKATTPCMRSTDQHPNWTLSAVRGADPETTREVVLTLLGMPASPDGVRWSITTDFQSTDRVFKAFRTGVYDVMNERSFSDFVDKYWLFAAVPLAAALLCFGFAALLRRMVEIRTRELKRTLENERRLRREVQEADERYRRLLRVGLLGQLSTMFAHEIRQPVGAILAYVQGLRNFCASGSLTPEISEGVLAKINAQAERVADIVERVRLYARTDAVDRITTDLRDVVEEAVGLFKRNTRFEGEIILEPPAPSEKFTVRVSSLEISIALHNLMQNAVDALASAGIADPRITIRIECTEERLVVVVSDNGPQLTQDEVARMTAPLHTTKSSGMGLGLILVNSIATGHGGHLRLSPAACGGLEARLILPHAGEHD